MRLRFSIGYPLAKEILVEYIPLAKEHFLVMSPFLQDFREFQPKYSPFKINFPKIDGNLAPIFKGFRKKIYPWLRTSEENIPLAKEFLPKIHPWLRNLGSKSDLWEQHTPSKVHITSEMINHLCKHCASSISIFTVSVQEFLCTY